MNKEDIILFIKEWPSAEGFVSPFINNIKHNRFYVDNVNFILCETEEEKRFWVDNINDYLHVYLYVLLAQWNNSYSSDVIKNHFQSYSEYYSKIIDSEMILLYKMKEKVPVEILETIGFTVDELSWVEDFRSPMLPGHLNKLGAFSEKLYQNYCNLYNQSLNSYDVKNILGNISQFIDYCNNTDAFALKTDCFKSLIERLLPSNIKKSNLIEEINILIEETLKEKRIDVGYDVLKILLQYYLANKELYIPSGCTKSLAQLQRGMFRIRVTDYLLNFYKFSDKSFDFEKDNLYGDYISIRDNKLFSSLWQKYVRPWNFLQYYEDSNHLKDFGDLYYGFFINNIYEDCNRIVEGTIKTAIDESRGDSWARKDLQEKTRNMFFKRVQVMLERMQSLLFSYIKEKTEVIVKNALEDSLTCFDGIQINAPQWNVLYKTVSLIENRISVVATYAKDEVCTFEIVCNWPKIKELYSHLDLIIPTDFIEMITNTYYSNFWSSWKMTTSDYNRERLTVCFNEYLEKYKKLFIMAIIWYLDYDIMINMK